MRGLTLAVASLGGAGFVPRGPATLGAVLGAGSFAALRPGRRAAIPLVAVATLLGQLCAATLERDHGSDPQYVIIDELAGVWLALALVPESATARVVAAILFRVLDKLKPGPVGLVDRRGGTLSLMGDDLVAGALAGVAVRAAAGAAWPWRHAAQQERR